MVLTNQDLPSPRVSLPCINKQTFRMENGEKRILFQNQKL